MARVFSRPSFCTLRRRASSASRDQVVLASRLTAARVCVNMSNMKTASIRQMQHSLAEVLSWVERGQEVLVYRRKKLVARLLPPTPGPVASPDFLARAGGVWGKSPGGKRLSEIITEGREEP